MEFKSDIFSRVLKPGVDGSGSSRFAAIVLAIFMIALLSACESGTSSQSSTMQLETTDQAPRLNIEVNAPLNYELDVLRSGTSAYVDSDYALTNVPANYGNLCLIRTAINDKFYSEPEFLTFNVNKPVTVYIAYAVRKNKGIPAWLETWTETGDRISLAPKDMSWEGSLKLFSKQFSPGSIHLGGNELGGFMYAVLVEDPQSSSLSACSTLSDASLSFSWEPNLDYVNGYRIYHGNTADDVNMEISEVHVTDFDFDPARPDVEYVAGTQLGLYVGESACFSVSAFDDEGESSKSPPICTTL